MINDYIIYITDTALEAKIQPFLDSLPVQCQIYAAQPMIAKWHLVLTHQGLYFYPPGDSHFKPYPMSFLQPTIQKRARGFGKKQPLAKAIGQASSPKSIIDATAGLGRDAFTLAYQGHPLTLIEQHPLLVAALRYAWRECQCEWSSNWRCIYADSNNWLLQNGAADVVYLDPMFESLGKAALAKKEAQLLQSLDLTSQDERNLLTCALQVAQDRVVVKRPRFGSYIDKTRPLNYQVKGKTHRFDVYMADG